MGITDATCILCNKPMRWLPGTPRVCAECRADARTYAADVSDEVLPASPAHNNPEQMVKGRGHMLMPMHLLPCE